MKSIRQLISGQSVQKANQICGCMVDIGVIMCAVFFWHIHFLSRVFAFFMHKTRGYA